MDEQKPPSEEKDADVAVPGEGWVLGVLVLFPPGVPGAFPPPHGG